MLRGPAIKSAMHCWPGTKINAGGSCSTCIWPDKLPATFATASWRRRSTTSATAGSAARLSVYRERRGCEIALKTLHDLRLALPTPSAAAPVAIGGALEHDPYRLPTTMVEICLREAGWRATSLGTLLPAGSLGEAVRENRPQLLWISVSYIESTSAFLDEYARLYDTAAELGAAVAVGGRALTEEIRQQMVYSAYCDTLRHLVTFVATLARAAPPRPMNPADAPRPTTPVDAVPTARIRAGNLAPINPSGEYVLYWMIAFRRTDWNFALQRAIEWAVELKRPLVIFEPLRLGYRWASDRLHRFVIDGMAENQARVAAAKNRGVLYFPYVEPAPNADKGLLAALAARACVVVTDDFPSFFLPRMVAAAAARTSVHLEQVDSNGLLPLAATDRVFSTAFSFRAYLQKELPRHLADFPRANPLTGAKLPPIEELPSEILRRWPAATAKLLSGNPAELANLSIDHSVGITDPRGGPLAARKRLREFLGRQISNYADAANQPDDDAPAGCRPICTSGIFHLTRYFTN